MNLLILEDYKNLFKNDKSFKKFVKILKNYLKNDLSIIILNGEIIGYCLSE